MGRKWTRLEPPLVVGVSTQTQQLPSKKGVIPYALNCMSRLHIPLRILWEILLVAPAGMQPASPMLDLSRRWLSDLKKTLRSRWYSTVQEGFAVLDVEAHLLVMEPDFTRLDESATQILLLFLAIGVACTRGWIFDGLRKRDLLCVCLRRIGSCAIWMRRWPTARYSINGYLTVLKP